MPGRCLAPEKARSSRSPILSSTSVLLTWMNWIPGHASAPVFAKSSAVLTIVCLLTTLAIALCNKDWHFWKGGFVTDKTGLKIFVFINAMIFAFTTFVTNTPLYGKIASKVWKIYFQYISPHFLDAAGGQISDLWLLLLSNSSLFSALMSHLPLLLLHSAMVPWC